MSGKPTTVTTERTGKEVKAQLALSGLGFWITLVLGFALHPLWWLATAACFVWHLLARGMKWWRYE